MYEIAYAMVWDDREAVLLVIENEKDKQPRNPNVYLISANRAKNEGDWISACGEATEAANLAPESAYADGLRSTICYHSRLSECTAREAVIFVKLRPKDAVAHIAPGHAMEMQANYSEALQEYREAERLYEGNSAIYEGIGRVYAQTGE